jgi:hypothetical protein
LVFLLTHESEKEKTSRAGGSPGATTHILRALDDTRADGSMMTRIVLTILLAVVTAGVATALREEYFSASSADPAGYLTWLSNQGMWYTSDAFVPSNIPGEGAAVFWEFVDDAVDAAANVTSNTTVFAADWKIQMAIAVPATGWVSLGFTLTGMMADSDVFVFDSAAPDTVTDYNIPATSPRSPMMDTCQNWELLDVRIDEVWTIVEVSRSLDTLDTQDLVIGASETVTLIAAWGDFGFGYHGPNKGIQTVSLFGEPTADMFETPFVQTTSFGSVPVECIKESIGE